MSGTGHVIKDVGDDDVFVVVRHPLMLLIFFLLINLVCMFRGVSQIFLEKVGFIGAT